MTGGSQESLCVLLTNGTTADNTDSELYVRDVALGLLQRGHRPVIYSPRRGKLARELSSAGILVTGELDSLGVTPSIIHGQHYLEAMAAVTVFQDVPLIYFCHGVSPWDETAPQHPSILRYVAISDVVRDWLVTRRRIEPDDIATILDFVDLGRFKPRSRLPDVPRRALALSNSMTDWLAGSVVREACKRNAIALDIVGMANRNPTACPEGLLGDYDLVFARGRGALEAIAVGAAVICCDVDGLGPLVTSENLEWLRRHNLGLVLNKALTVEGLSKEIGRYDAAEAGKVSEMLRATVGLDAALDNILNEYHRTLNMWANGCRRVITDDDKPYVWLSKVVRNEQAVLVEQRQQLQEKLERTATWRIRRRLLRRYPVYVLAWRLFMWVRRAHRRAGRDGIPAAHLSWFAPQRRPPDGCPWMACVVLSVGNEPGLVEAVRSLYAQPEIPEIVVVNSGGGNPLDALRAAGLDATIVNHEEILYPGAARNAGIRASRAPYVAFLAADCVAGPGWIEERLRYHRAGHHAVATAVVNSNRHSLCAWASYMMLYSRRTPSTSAEDAALYGVSYARDIFAYFGLFRPDFRTGEDSEFNGRLIGEIPIAWAPRVRTGHAHPTTFRGLISDSFFRGVRTSAWLAQRGATRMRWFEACNAIGGLPSRAVSVLAAAEPGDRKQAALAIPLMLPASVAFACGVFLPRRTGPVQSRSVRTGKPRILALLVFRNEMRFLPGYFENISPLVDGIVALDDGSTDGSGDFVREQPTVVHLITLPDEVPHHWNEPRIHGLCMQAAVEHGADWCIAVDADERLEMGFRDRAAMEMVRAEKEGYLAYAVKLRELWDRADMYRVDGLWGEKVAARFFRARWDYRIHPQELHGHWAPVNSMHHGGYPRADINVYHLRMIHKEDRLARRDRYRMIDPACKWQSIGYDYLADEDGLELERIPPQRLYQPLSRVNHD